VSKLDIKDSVVSKCRETEGSKYKQKLNKFEANVIWYLIQPQNSIGSDRLLFPSHNIITFSICVFPMLKSLNHKRWILSDSSMQDRLLDDDFTQLTAFDLFGNDDLKDSILQAGFNLLMVNSSRELEAAVEAAV